MQDRNGELKNTFIYGLYPSVAKKKKRQTPKKDLTK